MMGMRKNEQFALEIMTQFLSAQLTRKEAAELLPMRERSVSRLAARIRSKGLLGAIHGNRGRAASNQHPQAFEQMVMDLVRLRYFDCNMTHALELLKAEQGIQVKYSTFRRWSHRAHLVKRRKRRKAQARYARVRMPNEGLLLQFDGSPHRYNGKDEWCLIAAIDDATSDVPYAEFFLSEDTISCLQVMKKIVQLKGIPHAVYVDRAGWLGGVKRQHFTQFKRACEELGIRVLFAQSAEAKGRIERAWDTMQDRLVPEMRLRNIQRMPAANCYLQEQFLPNYWRARNKAAPKSLESRYRPLPADLPLDEIFCIKEHRCVKRDHTLQWGGQTYRLQSPIQYSIRGQKIEIRTYVDLSWKAFFAGKPIELSPFSPPASRSPLNSEVPPPDALTAA
jgi:transposase-like protein